MLKFHRFYNNINVLFMEHCLCNAEICQLKKKILIRYKKKKENL